MKKTNVSKKIFSIAIASLMMLSLMTVNVNAKTITDPKVNISTVMKGDIIPVGTTLVIDQPNDAIFRYYKNNTELTFPVLTFLTGDEYEMPETYQEATTITGYWLVGLVDIDPSGLYTYSIFPLTLSNCNSLANTEVQLRRNTIGTNTLTATEIQNSVKTAIGDYPIAVEVTKFNKVDATFTEDGSITLTVKLTCGGETQEIDASIRIAQLIKTDAEKLNEAKLLAESAIAGSAVANDTAATNILDNVNTSIASLNGVSASWKAGSPVITAATKANAGSITGTIILTCGSETVEVAVNKAIATIPGNGGPKTGDNSNLAIYATGLLLSGFAVISFRKKKNFNK